MLFKLKTTVLKKINVYKLTINKFRLKIISFQNTRAISLLIGIVVYCLWKRNFVSFWSMIRPIAVVAGDQIEETLLGPLSLRMEFTGTHALNRERHSLVFRKCWGIMGSYPNEFWKPVLRSKGSYTENRVLNIFLQTNFRWLILFACFLMLFQYITCHVT